MTETMRAISTLIILGALLAGLTGCTPPVTQPASAPTPTLLPGWETHSNQSECSYAIDHPSNMDVTSQGTYSWLIGVSTTEPAGPVPNFIYISVIPDGFQNEPGAIYNYDPGETQSLLNMQVGESRSLREDPTTAPWFTYTRLPDTIVGIQAAQTYENTQPWEFPPSTKEIRYYLQGNGCTYLIGAYLATVGSGQPGAIGEDLFDQIIATFRLAL
jgi:hypothetical protein